MNLNFNCLATKINIFTDEVFHITTIIKTKGKTWCNTEALILKDINISSCASNTGTVNSEK